MTHLTLTSLILNNLTTKLCLIVVLSIVMTSYGHALPVEIPAIAAMGNKIMPYLTWLIPIGGGSIVCVNGWRCLNNGQPKAGMYALAGAGVIGLGFTGIFGEGAATLLI